MKHQNAPSRREFLAVNAAALGVAIAPAVGSASVGPTPTVTAPTDWARVTAPEMSQLIGTRFKVTAADGRQGVLELVDVEPVRSGAERPSHLPRAEGLIAVFDSPDKDHFIADEHALYQVSNARLGSSTLFLGRSPRRAGGDVIEMVLN